MSKQKSLEGFISFSGKRKSEPLKNETIAEKNKKYDKEKRERKFVPSWKDTFPWINYDSINNLMTCDICSQYPSVSSRNGRNTFLEGSGQFRIHYLRRHYASDIHRECESYFRTNKKADTTQSLPNATESEAQTVSNSTKSTIPKALKKLDKQTYQKIEKLFITAYYLALKGKPLSDFEFQLELLDRVEVDIGNKYRNSAAAKDFIKAIACSLKRDFMDEIQNVKFVSVLSDGSTDSAIQEQETVFVRYISASGVPVTVHAETVTLSHCHSDGVLDGIRGALTNLDLSLDKLVDHEQDGPNLISVNFDGAAVMMGKKSGVATKIAEMSSHKIIPMHCVAHKLELAVLDSAKSCPQLAKFEEVLKQIFKMYHFSPKMKREIKEIANMFNTEFVHLGGIKQVRWLASKVRAVQALRRSFNAILIHLESVATGKNDNSCKAKGWLVSMKNVSFIKTMFVLLDVLPVLTEVSLVFQREDLLVTEVTEELEGLLLKIVNLKVDPMSGVNIKYFFNHYDHENSTFKDTIKLRGNCPPVNLKEDSFLVPFLDGILKYVDTRFVNFKETPLKNFNIFNYRDWPNDRADLSQHGKEELTELLTYFSTFFPDQRQIQDEYTHLKGYLKGCNKPMFDTYKRMLVSKQEKFANISKVIELMFTLSPATAICERMFSSMNTVKTNHRTLLNQESLNNILTVMTHGPQSLKEFCPRAAICEWLVSTPGTRHLMSMQVAAAAADETSNKSGSVESSGSSCVGLSTPSKQAY